LELECTQAQAINKTGCYCDLEGRTTGNRMGRDIFEDA